MIFHYTVSGTDFSQAGAASADIKKKLQMLGIPVSVVKRTAVAMYEAEINMVVHADGGETTVEVTDTEIVIIMADRGPGIPDIGLAMQEGYSTAPPLVQELGFGAGMGLPNMKRNSDFLTIESQPGEGTTVTMRIVISEHPEAES